MKPGYILALDQGTTSSRAIVFDHAGQARAVGQTSFKQNYPHPGWVEHDALEILSSQLAAITQALVVGEVEPADIHGIGITNQRETTVVWHRATGTPIAPAIVWQCRRTSEAVEQLAAAPQVRERIRATTGLVPDAYFSASKIAWLLNNVEGARAAATAGELAFGTIDSWLIWQLTGGAVHATDYTNASRTMLFDIHRGTWCPWLLELFDVPASLLPEVRASAAFYGTTAHPSLPNGIPLCGVAGDQQAALFGQGCFAPGEAKNTYGTGCFLLVHTGEEAPLSQHRLLTTIVASPPETRVAEAAGAGAAGTAGAGTAAGAAEAGAAAGAAEAGAGAATGATTATKAAQSARPHLEYAIEGSVFVAGALIEWLCNELELFASAEEIERLAQSCTDTAGTHIVPAFTGLGAPYWNQEARGALLGLTRGTTRSHIARAALEAIAFQVADLVAAVRADTGLALTHLKVDGGAAANNALLQFQSDLLDTQLIRPANTETTALGAAFLAGLTCGFWEDLAELSALSANKESTSFYPALDATQRSARLAAWAKAVACVSGAPS